MTSRQDLPKEQERRPGILRLLVILVCVAAGAAAGLFGSGAVLDHLAPEKADARGSGGPVGRTTLVATTRPGSSVVRETAEAVGTVEGVQAVEIVPMAAGRVVEIAFRAGQEVEAGELLVQLDDRAQQAQLKEAQATLAEAQQAFERAQALQQGNYAPEARLEEARATMLRAEAAVDRAENEIEDRRVVAPFAGTTGLVEVTTGQRVDTGTTITSLDDLSEVEVTFSVPELFFPRVRRGMPVVVTSRAYGSRSFEGQVSEVDARISPRSRAFRVRATIPNEDGSLRTGMFMSIQLVLEERQAITVPEEAVISEGDSNYVFTVAGNQAEKRRIRTGIWRDGHVEVLEGLQAEASIVTSGMQGLQDGAQIRLKEASDGAGETAARSG
ncbi:efflux RND transporter periplasmic adaptor subunit [Lutibaculum baratangense]|uniref:Uncharacterized protein n=1 Tax=Lutibaculum baratangense AMV1 TaxID=631454 RepID=V4T986_9HYPH|nr:efflux RND transporter periplasmic adaptor subunit [Lutibaculum baratangense]ESR23093.1 hypothetical protein N177_3161 [Lutibaculum baratangense AMV1]